MSGRTHIGLLCGFGSGWQGGVEYLRNLAACLQSLAADGEDSFELTLVHPDGDAASESTIGGGQFKDAWFHDYRPAPRPLTTRVANRIQRSLGGEEPSRLEHFLNDLNLDFLYPYDTEHPGRHSFRYASWIPDFQHRFLPDLFSSEEIAARDACHERAARLAPTVVVSSQTARGHLEEFHPQASGKIRMLRFATRPSDAWFEPDAKSVCDSYNLPDRFFMLPNQFWKHKNHTLVFQAMERLGEEGARPAIVCTGPLYDHRHPTFSSEVMQEIQRRGLGAQVILLGLVPKRDQVQMLRRCVGILQPSLFEGWSTVVEEARCLGKRILLSDLPVHREQDPPHGSFFATDDAGTLSEKIVEAWADWKPGPDDALETEARAAAAEAALDYARNFLSIARDASSP